MRLLWRGLRWLSAGQEVERAADCHQMLAGDPELPDGIECPMPQHHLDRPDIDSRFQQAGRKAMAQGVDAMTVQRYQLTAASGTRVVDTWYATTTDGDTAVITLPDATAVWLVYQPRAHVYWWTTGERGLTISLADARQRLAMV